MSGFEFTYSPFWGIPAALVAFALSWLMYRNTADRIATPLRYGLTILRGLSIWFLLMLLLEPILRTTEKIKNLPVVVYLHDASESMVATSDSTRVLKQLPGYFAEFQNNLKNEEADVHAFTYGDGLSGTAHKDSLTYRQSNTNISAALKEIKDRFSGRHLAAVVLVSDGIYTRGDNPVYMLDRLGVPIFTVLAGDTIPRKDAAIGDVLVNSITYLGSEVPVRVSVRTSGYAEAELEVKLLHKGKVLGVQKVITKDRDPEKEVFFTVKPEETGQLAYEVVISPLRDEVNLRNNQTRFYLRVLENRMRIALFAGGPHPDLGALNKALKRFDEYELKSYIRKTKTTFYEPIAQDALSSSDAFILHNFPAGPQDKELLNQILNQVEKRNVPIMFFAGNGTNYQTEDRLLKYLGIVPASYSDQSSEALVYTEEDYHNHVTWTFDRKWDEWLSNAPPIQRNNSDWQPKSNTRVYGKAIIKGVKLPFPVFGFQEQLGRKNMVFVGENIWRWRSHSYMETNDFNYFDQWIGNCFQWLTTREDKRKFKVYPTRNLFTANERVMIQGEVYDDVYQPVSGAEIQFELKNEEDEVQSFFMNENADRQYALELFGLQEGNYRFRAEWKQNGVVKGTDQGQFSIGASAAEFVRLTADAGIMRQLANRSGGESVAMEDLPQLADQLMNLNTMKTITDTRITAMDINRLFWPLMLLIALLGIEWVVRKFFGLS